MKSIRLCLISVIAVAASVEGTVTLTYQFSGLLTSSSASVPIGSVGVIVADTSGDGFLADYITGSASFSDFAGTSLTIGSNLGSSSDDTIISVFTAIDLGGGFTGFNDQETITLSGSLGTGDNLALYWFPDVSVNSIAGAVSQYGFFRTDSISSGSGSQMAFVMPADGVNLTLASASVSIGGDIPDSALTAVAVPEPSTYAAILGALALGFVAYRRRKA